MNAVGRSLLALAVLASATCGGGKGGSTPTNPTPTITAAAVAPTLAAEINTTFKAALRAGVGTASADRNGPRVWLARLIDQFLSVRLSAQGGFVANCSRGGNIRIQNLVAAPGGGRVQMSSTPVTITSCGHSLNGRDIFASGTLIATGTWTATEPDTPVRLSGDLTVPDIGTIGINGDTGASFNGNVGGVTVGTPNTTSTVITTSTSTTTSSTTTTTSAPGTTTSTATTTSVPTTTTSVATTTSAASTTTTSVAGGTTNLTGTWISPGTSGSLIITQTGSSLSCRTTPLPAGTTEPTCAGTVNGNQVTINEVLVVVSTVATITGTCTVTTVSTLTITSPTTMSGSGTASGQCVFTGPNAPGPTTVPPVTAAVTLQKQS